VDLDLDISAPVPLSNEPEVAPPLDAFAELPSLDLPSMAPAPSPEPLPEADDHGLDFDLPLEPSPAPVAAAPEPSHAAFDLGDLNLDLDAPAPAPQPASAGLSLDDDLSQPSDPMERKLELAEEFRQIGDIDGARELLQEVVDNATGGLQAKARSMLDSLS
ncbi:MAG: hypothetical protein EOP38_22665, partial [Rubrivivax sp.]